MVSGRPLIYLSVPGLALLFGLCWLHRKKVVKCSKNKKNESIEETHDNKSNEHTKHTASVCINKKVSTNNDNIDGKLGKSAPINIIQNGKGLIYQGDQNGSEAMNSIEEGIESMSSSVNLSGTADSVKYFPTKRIRANMPEGSFIIKATKDAKISPEDSFLENKYTEEEQNIIEKCDIPEMEENVSTNIVENDISSISPVVSCSALSNDSGNGCSLSHTSTEQKTYEFILPVNLIPRLCGKKNVHLKDIKLKSKANIYFKKRLNSFKVKSCIIEGTDNEISTALALIRDRLPADSLAKLSMGRFDLDFPQEIYTFNLAENQLRLVEGINNDVGVSAIASGGHVFLQHPLHPSYPSLTVLQNHLIEYYSHKDAPLLPEIIENAICVGKVDEVWYRVQIIKSQGEDAVIQAKLLDVGGFCSIYVNDLRQIRAEFMLLPFQATECVLSNVAPKGDTWSLEAAEVLTHLVRGIILQAQIIGYNSSNLPEIYLFAKLAPNCIVFVNKELVARGLARWTEDTN